MARAMLICLLLIAFLCGTAVLVVHLLTNPSNFLVPALLGSTVVRSRWRHLA